MKLAAQIVFLILCVICALGFLGSKGKDENIKFLFGTTIFALLIILTQALW